MSESPQITTENNGKRAKKPYHVSLKNAVKLGWVGEGFSEDMRPGRRARAARVIASGLHLNPTMRQAQRSQEAETSKYNRRFEATKAAAQGMNRKVLELIERSEELPTNRPADNSTSPWGEMAVLFEDPKEAGVMYGRTFRVNNAKVDNNILDKYAVSVADEKSSRPLTLSLSTEDGRDIAIPVHTVSIFYKAPAEFDQTNFDYSNIGAGTTRVVINDQAASNNEHSRMYKKTAHGVAINNDSSLDGQVEFSLTNSGALGGVQVGRNNLDYRTDMPGAQVNVSDFLSQLSYSLFEAETINRVPTSPAQL